MNDLKKKILKGIQKDGLQEWVFMVSDYDDIVDYVNLTNEDIDELANNILNEINKQSDLNDNQRIVLKWLKEQCTDNGKENPIIYIWLLHDEYAMGEGNAEITAYTKLTSKQEFQVLQAFSQWALEQEETK